MSEAHEPLVSVLIPTYNGAGVLRETLHSAQQQTYRNLQIIVVDDGSTDETVAITQEVARADNRFLVLQQANGGTQAARNTALRHARGEFVALLDQDDIWMPGKIEAQLKLFLDVPATTLAYTNYFNWDGEQDLGLRYSQPHKMPEGDVTRGLINTCLFGAATVMLRKSTLDEVGAFDEKLIHTGDWDMWLRLAENAAKSEGGFLAHGTWEPLIRYRLWPGNASRNRIAMAEGSLRVVEKALRRPQSEERRAWYEAALRRARANLALSQASQQLELLSSQTAGVAARKMARREVARGVAEAWSSERRVKFLLWYLACKWPSALGGSLMADRVYRRLRQKW